jgi:hypothetical protein
MGQEARCRVRFGEQAGEGKALLEAHELVFRGAFRLVIPFRAIESLEEAGGELAVRWPDGRAVFALGPQAAKWAAKIRNPRSRLDKLGVKPGQVVSVLGVADAGFLDELRERTSAVHCDNEAAPESDLVFYAADRLEDLTRLAAIEGWINRKGAVWVVSPKGKGALIKDVDVMAAGKAAGLVDTKVVAFSETHTALKLVIPLARR